MTHLYRHSPVTKQKYTRKLSVVINEVVSSKATVVFLRQ
jgi:hypothetical protein